jgi:hypothetical protein
MKHLQDKPIRFTQNIIKKHKSHHSLQLFSKRIATLAAMILLINPTAYGEQVWTTGPAPEVVVTATQITGDPGDEITFNCPPVSG